MHDLIITGGVVHDGLGSPGVRADVAIEAGRVIAVGDDVGPASRTISAEGRFVTPGFVDAHAHSDAVPMMAEHVLLGGTVVVDQGVFSGVRAGDVLRAGSS